MEGGLGPPFLRHCVFTMRCKIWIERGILQFRAYAPLSVPSLLGGAPGPWRSPASRQSRQNLRMRGPETKLLTTVSGERRARAEEYKRSHCPEGLWVRRRPGRNQILTPVVGPAAGVSAPTDRFAWRP